MRFLMVCTQTLVISDSPQGSWIAGILATQSSKPLKALKSINNVNIDKDMWRNGWTLSLNYFSDHLLSGYLQYNKPFNHYNRWKKKVSKGIALTFQIMCLVCCFDFVELLIIFCTIWPVVKKHLICEQTLGSAFSLV